MSIKFVLFYVPAFKYPDFNSSEFDGPVNHTSMTRQPVSHTTNTDQPTNHASSPDYRYYAIVAVVCVMTLFFCLTGTLIWVLTGSKQSRSNAEEEVRLKSVSSNGEDTQCAADGDVCSGVAC